MSVNPDALITWLETNGGFFHPQAAFTPAPSGCSVVAKEDISADVIIVSCPFSLAITPTVARTALTSILNQAYTAWSERQLICSYLIFHWIIESEEALRSALFHQPYVSTLPASEKLRTSLHFTTEELEEFRGTNIYGATINRESQWKQEWEQCQAAITAINASWGREYTWERYLTAATYLSSRAFPSTILSEEPTLVPTTDSYPILLPGVDSLNHARAHPVSWVISRNVKDDTADLASNNAIVSLVIHKPMSAGDELFNNYGAKPNSELILGYGFSIPENPEDTIVLAIGGSTGASSNKLEVGRNAQGVKAVWEEVLLRVKSAPEEDKGVEEDDVHEAYEDKLEAAQVLAEMVLTLMDKLPSQEGGAKRAARMRPEVTTMLHDYISGQRDILEAILKFSCEKEQEAVEDAKEVGIELVFD